MRTTHTFATMEVSNLTFREIEARLRSAGYDHAIDVDDGTPMLMLDGIAAVPVDPKKLEGSTDAEWTIEQIEHERELIEVLADTTIKVRVRRYLGLLDLAQATLEHSLASKK